MSDQIENRINKAEKEPSKFAMLHVSWYTPERCLNGLLLTSVIQIIIALLLYLIAAIKLEVNLVGAAVSIVLAMLAHFKAGENRLSRVVIRIASIIVLAGLPVFYAVLIIVSYFINRSADVMNYLAATEEALIIILYLVLIPVLFFQPVLAVMSKYRRRFDLVLARIAGITALILSVCVNILEYYLGDDKPILTSFETPKLFGQSIKVDIDNIVIRIIFIGCSAAFVVFSFMLRWHPSQKIKKVKSSGDDKKR